jgi:hypothetical protein
VEAVLARPRRTSISLCSRRTALGRRYPPTSLFGLLPPKTGHERTTPATHKPDSQELIRSSWPMATTADVIGANNIPALGRRFESRRHQRMAETSQISRVFGAKWAQKAFCSTTISTTSARMRQLRTSEGSIPAITGVCQSTATLHLSVRMRELFFAYSSHSFRTDGREIARRRILRQDVT